MSKLTYRPCLLYDDTSRHRACSTVHRVPLIHIQYLRHQTHPPPRRDVVSSHQPINPPQTRSHSPYWMATARANGHLGARQSFTHILDRPIERMHSQNSTHPSTPFADQSRRPQPPSPFPFLSRAIDTIRTQNEAQPIGFLPQLPRFFRSQQPDPTRDPRLLRPAPPPPARPTFLVRLPLPLSLT